SLLGSVTLNQKVDPTGNTYDGKNWVLLGTYTVKGPSVAITLRRPQVLSANGMIADGARIERVGGSATPYAAAPAAVASSAKSAVALPTLTTLPAQDTAPSVMPLVTQSDTAGAGVGGAAGGAPVAGYPSRNCPQGYPNCSCPLSMNWRECGEWSCPNANREFDELRNQCVCREGWGCADGSDSPYCDCQPLSCPDGYWLNPETYTCIPNTVCGDGYLDRTGFPREICELDGNRGCPEGEFCLNCTSCLVCGDTLLTNNEECEADFTCPLGTSCSASCQCSDSATSQSKNTTILDISSHLMTQTTISSDITRTSWTVPVRTGETYDIYVRTQKYNMTMNNNRMYACPTNFWKVFNGSTRVLPLSNDQKLQYGDPLCYPDSYASVSPTWILLTQIQASATSIRVEHEPSPLPANASATDPARRLAIADSIRIEKVADASSSSSSAWTDCPSGYSCPVLWVNNQCARRSITCGIGKILQCDSTCGNGDCSGPCCKCVQGSSSSRSSSSSSSTSSLACVQEGQSAAVLPGAATCCSGLNGVVATGPLQDGSCSDALPGGAFRCVRCGNGSCGLGENYCNCLADCPRPQSSSSSSSVSSAWTTCSGDFLCTALWSGNQCAYRSIDCPIGFNTLCNTACGNSVCPGACCKCVPGSSSSRSSSASSTSATGIAWTQVGPPHTSGNSCATECAARGQTCAATGCVPSTTWNGMTFTGGEKIVANGANYSYTCSNDWGAIHQSYQNYCCCTGSAPVLSSSSSRSFSSVPSVTCTDSDGNDPFTAGTVQIGNQTYRDDCTTCGSNSLPCLAVDERLCDGSQVTSEIKNCSALRAGFICKDGRCVTACGDGMVNMGEQCDGTLISACSPGQTCSADCRCVSEPPSSVQWQTVGSSYLVSTLSDYA
ncbi:MAG: hypothetical protein PHO92_05800, partial [Candidatus Peribacteraceae bacterium]|nr:hypothetical protein [Candidatus Peribacteraceae bacterium]